MHRLRRVLEEIGHKISVHHLGNERGIWCGQFGERDQNGVQRGVCRGLVLGHLGAPVALAAAADVPVGEHVGKVLKGAGGLGYLVLCKVAVHQLYERVELGQYPLVHKRQLAIL